MWRVPFAIALLLILGSPFVVPVAADDGEHDDEDEDESDLGEVLGVLATVLLCVTLAYFPYKRRVPAIVPWAEKVGFEKESAREFMKKFHPRFRHFHFWIGGATVVIGTIHGYLLESHWMLWTAMVIMGWLSVAGWLMTKKWVPKKTRKGLWLLHGQWVFTVATIILLFVGHQIGVRAGKAQVRRHVPGWLRSK